MIVNRFYRSKAISHRDSCVLSTQGMLQHFGRIDVLVNNAAIGGEPKRIHELTEIDWDEVGDINLKEYFYVHGSSKNAC
jgi:NAD(P)-dependent dehydrogenase (short-subunit alcohol dehydrogenase family)